MTKMTIEGNRSRVNRSLAIGFKFQAKLNQKDTARMPATMPDFVSELTRSDCENPSDSSKQKTESLARLTSLPDDFI